MEGFIYLALFLTALGGIWRLLNRSAPPEALTSLLASAPRSLSSKHCFYCAKALGRSDSHHLGQYMHVDAKSLLSFDVQAYLFPFCAAHDPIQLSSPLSANLQDLLDQGREAAAPRELARKAQVGNDSFMNRVAGQAVGVFAGGFWGGAIAGLAGELLVIAKSSAQGFQQFYARNSDLILRINLQEFLVLEGSSALIEVGSKGLSPLLKVLDETDRHLNARIELLARLATSPETELAVTATRSGLDEVNAFRKRVLEAGNRRARVVQKSNQIEERLVQQLVDLKNARDAGLISEQAYLSQEAELKRKAA